MSHSFLPEDAGRKAVTVLTAMTLIVAAIYCRWVLSHWADNAPVDAFGYLIALLLYVAAPTAAVYKISSRIFIQEEPEENPHKTNEL